MLTTAEWCECQPPLDLRRCNAVRALYGLAPLTDEQRGTERWTLDELRARKPTVPTRRRSPATATMQPTGEQPTAPSPGLGDHVASALSAVGITEERVSAWLGRPCGCGARKRKLNELGKWAASFFTGTATKDDVEKLLQ